MNKTKFIKHSKVSHFDYERAKITDYAEVCDGPFSVAYVRYDGRLPKEKFMINHDCNETYIIIAGEFQITIKNDKEYKLSEGDYLFVPKGVHYSVEGKGKLIAINDPKWSEVQFEMNVE